MNFKTIAKMTGTTVSTVSKAFRESAEISQATKDKIFNAAKELGCFEKYYKGKQKKRLVGIICPEPESEIYGITVGSIEKALSSRGIETFIGISRFDKKRSASLYSELIYRARADGVIIIGSGSDLKNPDNIPTVMMGEVSSESSVGIGVSINLEETMDELFALIKKHGYKKIGFIGESLTESRLNAYRHAMRKHGFPLQESFIYIADDSRFAEAGIDGMSSFIERGNIPEIIITAYDNIAFGAMKVARERGYKIPEDISFVGINDITTSEYLDVPLTTIGTSDAHMTEKVVEILISKMDNKAGSRNRSSLVFPANLKIRESIKIK